MIFLPRREGMVCAATLTLAFALIPSAAEGAAEALRAAPGPRGSASAESAAGAASASSGSRSAGAASGAAAAAASSNAGASSAWGEGNVRSPRTHESLAALQKAVRKRRAQMTAVWKRRARKAVEYAHAQRGRPYVWGGTGERGFDCSGLVQQAWRHAGVTIPRVSHDQYEQITTKVSRDNLRPGDLVFFNRLRHVGIYVGGGRFVHAPRTGRPITVEGLKGRYAHTYAGAVRPGWEPLPPVPSGT
ncbi:C40 family peptidase [Spirillospora sp. CA-255316]